ncbi:MAG: hypothetical protein SCM11_15275 [Bacillota bacterium]|nr:hypothetical protein [Bacillota bacterium]
MKIKLLFRILLALYLTGILGLMLSCAGPNTEVTTRDLSLQTSTTESIHQPNLVFTNQQAICARDYREVGLTVGLNRNGTVSGVGFHYISETSTWRDIVSLAAGGGHIVGLKSDGTAIAVGYNENHQTDVNAWQNIVSIACGVVHTVDLQQDGTVISAGWNEFQQCDTATWKDVVAIAAGYAQTVAINKEGDVLAVGDNQCG